jgi:RNA polymerase sigma factor (sigma-70 family)
VPTPEELDRLSAEENNCLKHQKKIEKIIISPNLSRKNGSKKIIEPKYGASKSLLSIFFEQIPPRKGLSFEDIKHLVNQSKNGCIKSRNELINENMGFIVSRAMKFSGKTKHLELLDLIQEGVLGFIEALKLYDPETGYTLNTYTRWWIESYIMRTISLKEKVVRTHANARNDLKFIYLNDPLGDDKEIGDHFRTNDDDPDPLSEAIDRDTDRYIRKIVEKIPNKDQRAVIIRYYGLDGKPPDKSFNALSRSLNIPPSKANRLFKLANSFLKEKLKDQA